MPASDVTIVGCGLMGSALARGLARAGYEVAAWNRTHERAEALAGNGITPIRSVADAVATSPLILVCTTTYDDAWSVLEPVDRWNGHTLINVTSGAPEEAVAFARWASDRGVEYFDGGLFCYPQDIGTAKAVIYFSGPSAVWSKHEALLTSLGGGARHVSEDVAAANVLYVGANVFFTAAQAAYVEAATYLVQQGISKATLHEISIPPLDTLRVSSRDAAEAISTGVFETDQATLSIFAEGARFSLAALGAAGHHPPVFAAVVESLNAAEAAGRGHLGFAALSELAIKDAPQN